jgi:hypothetical protein
MKFHWPGSHTTRPIAFSARVRFAVLRDLPMANECVPTRIKKSGVLDTSRASKAFVVPTIEHGGNRISVRPR